MKKNKCRVGSAHQEEETKESVGWALPTRRKIQKRKKISGLRPHLERSRFLLEKRKRGKENQYPGGPSGRLEELVGWVERAAKPIK